MAHRYIFIFLFSLLCQWGSGQEVARVVKQRLVEMMPDLRVFLGALQP